MLGRLLSFEEICRRERETSTKQLTKVVVRLLGTTRASADSRNLITSLIQQLEYLALASKQGSSTGNLFQKIPRSAQLSRLEWLELVARFRQSCQSALMQDCRLLSSWILSISFLTE